MQQKYTRQVPTQQLLIICEAELAAMSKERTKQGRFQSW